MNFREILRKVLNSWTLLYPGFTVYCCSLAYCKSCLSPPHPTTVHNKIILAKYSHCRRRRCPGLSDRLEHFPFPPPIRHRPHSPPTPPRSSQPASRPSVIDYNSIRIGNGSVHIVRWWVGKEAPTRMPCRSQPTFCPVPVRVP